MRRTLACWVWRCIADGVAFYAWLTDNLGPVTQHTDVVLDRVITNIGDAYDVQTGRFTAPLHAVYQFNVIISAQGRHKVTVTSRDSALFGRFLQSISQCWIKSEHEMSRYATDCSMTALKRNAQTPMVSLVRVTDLY